MARRKFALVLVLPLTLAAAPAELAVRNANVITMEASRPDNTGVRYGAIKLFHDNSLSGQTCWLSKPYANRPGYCGVPPARSQESLNALVHRVHAAGLQACVHCNGDREIEMVLNAFEEDRKGSMAAGQLADFVVLAADPTKVEPNRIRHSAVERVFVGGREVAAPRPSTGR